MTRTSAIPIVGIGASAGGLEALKAFLSTTSPFSGAAYVIVQHLSPDQKSILHELLQSETSLSVRQAVDKEKLEPNHFYVIPPGRVATLNGQTIKLTKRNTHDSQHRPIDTFFTSLSALGRDAYCVVLSGTGTDGSSGLKRVKASGGFALVQESMGARFPGMPDSAIATGLVDFILPSEKLARRIEDIIRHRQSLTSPTSARDTKAAIEKALPQLTERLAEVSGNDFSNYKPGTLVRRIERRMNLLRVAETSEFLTILKDDQQAQLLAQEFLIGVTEFFRDPDAFDALRELVVLPLLKESGSTIRIWVPGCSTGEEVYSLAMLFTEEMEARKDRRVLQVFGTDIDTPSLFAARSGIFSPAAVSKLSSARKDRFFQAENGQYRAIPKLRDTCIFAPHNLLQDPPFSKLDLISCRNLLIYLSSSIQRNVIPRFHFSLKPNGRLFLGPSEGLAGEEELFEVLEKRHRIFKKNNDAPTTYSSLMEMKRLPSSTRPPRRLPAIEETLKYDVSREALVEREFLQDFAAPFALISSEGAIIYLSKRMTEFVQPAQGIPSTLIDAFLLPELRQPVRNTLLSAKSTKARQVFENVVIVDGPSHVIYDVEVAPSGAEFVLVLHKVRTTDTADLSDAMSVREVEDKSALEAENIQLRKQLSLTLSDFETSGQELKSTNEELMSMNEELQSSNEELETSREELQSINEELETVNAELQENNRLLTRVNSDLKNLFESTDVAILFLDREFCVRNFTPPTSSIFGIRRRDIGRPISDLSARVNYPTLREDALQVDTTLQTLEREVHIDATRETFLLRLKPYRTTDNRIDGYVLSFIEITQRKNFEETLRLNEKKLAQQYAELENLYDTTPVGLSLLDRELRWLRINESLAQINGFSPKEHIGKTFKELLPDIEDRISSIYEKVFETGEPVLNLEITGETNAAPGVLRHWIGDFYPVWQEDAVFAVGACIREVTEQTKMMQSVTAQNKRQKLLMGELQHRVKNTLAIISSISRLLLRDISDPRTYQERLESRLSAISRTHDLLTQSNWTTASLKEIVTNEGAPFAQQNKKRIKLEGPDLSLSAEQALSLGMAIHELMTNAAKYGSLSVHSGSVVVSTTKEVEGDETFATISWQEIGGPEITKKPSHRGFGSLVIERVLKHDLNGKVHIDYTKTGMQFSVRFHLPEGALAASQELSF